LLNTAKFLQEGKEEATTAEAAAAGGNAPSSTVEMPIENSAAVVSLPFTEEKV
jgi:hypothetical protein